MNERMILETAERLLAMKPDPVPKLLILRDVLRLDQEDSEFRHAREGLSESRWITLLYDSQWEDGTWGRFHTQDTKVKQPIPTTETAISLALDLGLDRESALLKKTTAFLVDHIDGRVGWRDWPEKHDNPAAWFIVTPYISAANLALIDDAHPMIVPFRKTWEEIATAAFAGGSYDREAEIRTNNRLMSCERKNPYSFHVKYPLILLSATGKRLEERLERSILEYVLSASHGVYYMHGGKLSDAPSVGARGFYGWLRTQQLLSRFPLWREYAGTFVADILDQRNADGLWDFDAKVARKPFTPFPLSESWRRRENRTIDGSVVVLQLLSRYCTRSGM